jgi:hypothetical protein
MAENRDNLPIWIGRLLCALGFHDYHLVEVVGGFGEGGQVEKVECRRCGAPKCGHRMAGWRQGSGFGFQIRSLWRHADGGEERITSHSRPASGEAPRPVTVRGTAAD